MALSVEDRLDINDLLARQAWALDTGDSAAYLAGFTADANLNLADTHSGSAAIGKFFADFTARDPGLPGSQHIVSQIVIEGDGANATAKAYVTRTHRLPGRGRNNTMIIWAGWYDTKLTKSSGKWLIKEQTGRAWEGDILDKVHAARPKKTS
jgi:hypothetical protein